MDVIVSFCHVGYPVLKYQKQVMEGKPFGNKEYVVDCLIPAKTLKQIRKHYKKSNVKSLEKIKDYTAKEYEAAFKVKPPTDDKYKNEDGEYSILKFTAPAAYQDGEQNVKAVPKIVGVKSTKGKEGIIYKDAEGQIVGTQVSVGNGSVVNIHFSERDYTVPNSNSKGIRLQLLGIQIKNLIPYVKDEGGFDIDEEEGGDEGSFGDQSDGFAIEDNGQASEADEAAAAQSEAVGGDDDDDGWDN